MCQRVILKDIGFAVKNVKIIFLKYNYCKLNVVLAVFWAHEGTSYWGSTQYDSMGLGDPRQYGLLSWVIIICVDNYYIWYVLITKLGN